jgi:hypothetical protein
MTPVRAAIPESQEVRLHALRLRRRRRGLRYRARMARARLGAWLLHLARPKG